MIEVIKTYSDSIRHTVTIGKSYRCVNCGIIWARYKDALAHQATCKGKQNG